MSLYVHLLTYLSFRICVRPSVLVVYSVFLQMSWFSCLDILHMVCLSDIRLHSPSNWSSLDMLCRLFIRMNMAPSIRLSENILFSVRPVVQMAMYGLSFCMKTDDKLIIRFMVWVIVFKLNTEYCAHYAVGPSAGPSVRLPVCPSVRLFVFLHMSSYNVHAIVFICHGTAFPIQ